MEEAAETRPSLLLRIRDVRDDVAWRQFVEIYGPLIHAHCRRWGLQPSDAADVTQDVLCAVITAIRGFEYDRGKGRFRGWLLRAVRSKLCNHLSRSRRQPQGTGRTAVHDLLAAQPGPQEEGEWDTRCARRVFDWAARDVQLQFQETTWRAFWRTAVENVPAGDVAAELGISAGAVYIAKSRVLARIRARVHEIEQP